MKSEIYHLYAITGLHVGTGQGCGVIDLPIAREQASKLPIVPGSGVKGVLRYELEPKLKPEEHAALFGPKTDKADEHAGALSVGDARLLCLPVRSFCGTFAWATCPMVLHRYRRDLTKDKKEDNTLPNIPVPENNSTALCAQGTELETDGKIYLEDLDLNSVRDDDAERWAKLISSSIFRGDCESEWKTLLRQRFVVLSDSVFDFLSETATEIRARIKIKEDTRTVQKGGLWYEENLPAEAILWGIVAADKSRKKNDSRSDQEMISMLPESAPLQVGGNATVGAGQVRWLLGIKGEQS